MSARRLVTIMCDAPLCGEWWDAGVADTATEARRQLRGSGWRTAVASARAYADEPVDSRAARDYCPRHANGRVNG